MEPPPTPPQMRWSPSPSPEYEQERVPEYEPERVPEYEAERGPDFPFGAQIDYIREHLVYAYHAAQQIKDHLNA